MDNERLFAKKIYICLQLLGAGSDLLSTVGSWRVDANDEDTLSMLDVWIEQTIIDQQQSLNQVVKLL